MSADGPLTVINNIGGAWDGAQLTIHLKNLFFATFLLSNLAYTKLSLVKRWFLGEL